MPYAVHAVPRLVLVQDLASLPRPSRKQPSFTLGKTLAGESVSPQSSCDWRGLVFAQVTCNPVLFGGARQLHAFQGRYVAGDAPIQRLRDLLAVSVAAKLLLVGRTADKGDFR